MEQWEPNPFMFSQWPKNPPHALFLCVFWGSHKRELRIFICRLSFFFYQPSILIWFCSLFLSFFHSFILYFLFPFLFLFLCLINFLFIPFSDILPSFLSFIFNCFYPPFIFPFNHISLSTFRPSILLLPHSLHLPFLIISVSLHSWFFFVFFSVPLGCRWKNIDYRWLIRYAYDWVEEVTGVKIKRLRRLWWRRWELWRFSLYTVK